MVNERAFAKRLASSVIGLAGLAYAAACAYLWTHQRALIYLPDAAVLRTPRDLGIEFREIAIPVAERSVINAWWLPADSGGSGGVTVLYLHGNDGNLGSEVERLRALRRHGLPILAIDYRGYGKSSGPAPSEPQMYEDATAAWDYLVRQRGVDPKRILVYGHSLGGAVAAVLVLHRGPACGIVFEATFTSMAEMAHLEYPMIPVDWLLSERFDTLSKIARLDLPMLFLHGTADDVVPPAMSERLYRAARADKRLILVAGARHEEALPGGGAPLSEAMARLARTCGNGR